MKKLIAVATIAMAGLGVGGSVFAGEVGGSANGKADGPIDEGRRPVDLRLLGPGRRRRG